MAGDSTATITLRGGRRRHLAYETKGREFHHQRHGETFPPPLCCLIPRDNEGPVTQMSVVLVFCDNACALWVLMENGRRWEELLGMATDSGRHIMRRAGKEERAGDVIRPVDGRERSGGLALRNRVGQPATTLHETTCFHWVSCCRCFQLNLAYDLHDSVKETFKCLPDVLHFRDDVPDDGLLSPKTALPV